METIDYSKEYIQSSHTDKHAAFFPRNIFCVIAGRTGSGKTNLMINFLLNEKTLNYKDVYIYSSTIYQPAYVQLKKRFDMLEDVIKTTTGVDVKIAHFFESDEEIKNPKELDSKSNHVMIFDDVMLDDQKTIKEYFCKGRHNNINVFYLCQSVFKVGKHCIRDNANMFILFNQHADTLKSFHERYISGDMKLDEFKAFCDNCWREKHGYAVINLWEEPYCGRYISNYKFVYTPQQYLAKLGITNSYISMTNKYK